MNEHQQEIAALVEEVKQTVRDLRSHVYGKVDKPEWYMWDKDLAAEARGDVDYHLQRAIGEDNQKAVLARGGSLPRLMELAQSLLAAEHRQHRTLDQERGY